MTRVYIWEGPGNYGEIPVFVGEGEPAQIAGELEDRFGDEWEEGATEEFLSYWREFDLNDLTLGEASLILAFCRGYDEDEHMGLDTRVLLDAQAAAYEYMASIVRLPTAAAVRAVGVECLSAAIRWEPRDLLESAVNGHVLFGLLPEGDVAILRVGLVGGPYWVRIGARGIGQEWGPGVGEVARALRLWAQDWAEGR